MLQRHLKRLSLPAIPLAAMVALPLLAAEPRPAVQQDRPGQQAAETDGWVDDVGLDLAFQQGAAALIEAGRAPEMADVRRGLEHRTCELDLPPRNQPAGGTHEHDDETIDSSTLYERARRSVAVVGSAYLCGRCDNWHVGGATGFFLTDDGVLVTNYHVVDQEERRAIFAMTADGRVFPVKETLAGDKRADVAILRVDSVDQRGERATFEPLELADGSRVGQTVRVISHPDGRHYTLTEGIVSRRYRDTRHGGTRWMTITADYARGSSGGPLFDEAGRVIGMVASTSSVYYDHDDDGDPRNLQMVWKQCVPVENIRALLRPSREQ